MSVQAGMQAVRENRYIVLAKDFEKGYKNNIKKDETEHEFYKWWDCDCVHGWTYDRKIKLLLFENSDM